MELVAHLERWLVSRCRSPSAKCVAGRPTAGRADGVLELLRANLLKTLWVAELSTLNRVPQNARSHAESCASSHAELPMLKDWEQHMREVLEGLVVEPADQEPQPDRALRRSPPRAAPASLHF
jgi:hypothetical protein